MTRRRSQDANRVRVAVYTRVSSNDQTAENQFRALREHAERAGWKIVSEFANHAVSGTREKRPGLDALLAEARRRRFDLIASAAIFGTSSPSSTNCSISASA